MALRKVANGEVKSIRQLAEEKWRSSGINGAQARRLRLRGLTAEQTAALGPNYHRAASLFIPYFDLTGRPTRFHRVRYLEPLPGFAGQVKKPERFTQDIRALNEVYLPPLFGRTWEQISQDAKTTLYITEGELKSASGCGAGLAVLGLGGVDVWRAAKRGITFLPILEKFIWKERPVGIVYDSDLATKPDVVRAQRSLAQELITRGALVSIVNVPPGKEGEKQGLDDFLVAEGADALQELLASAVPYPESDALWSLNEEVILIPKLGVVVERKSNDLIEVERFKRIVYANRHYMESTEVGKGKNKRTVLERKPLVPRWVEWEHRAELERLTYLPGKPPGEYDGMWNIWPGWGCEPKRGDIGPWNWLLDFLFKDDHKGRRWFEHWLAYPLQYPGTKMYAAALLWSHEHRVGKTLIAYAMKGIYGKNFAEIKSQDLRGNFNSWAKNRQFIYGDEINSREARVNTDWLKGLITEDDVTIEEKFLPKYTVPDHMNYYFASNRPDALFIDDRDKRFFVGEIRAQAAERAFYERMDRWLHNGGPSALFHYLTEMNLGNFSPREHAPDTEGKSNMIRLGKNDVAWWVQNLQDDATQALKSLGPGIGATCDLYTPRQLFRAFDPEGKNRSGEAALGRALAAAGLRQLNHSIPMRTALGYQRLYAVRHFEDWEQASSAEIREHFDKFWAPDSSERKM